MIDEQVVAALQQERDNKSCSYRHAPKMFSQQTVVSVLQLALGKIFAATVSLVKTVISAPVRRGLESSE